MDLFSPDQPAGRLMQMLQSAKISVEECLSVCTRRGVAKEGQELWALSDESLEDIATNFEILKAQVNIDRRRAQKK